MDNHDFLKILIKERITKQLLYEGLIFSYPPSKVIRGLKKMGFSDVNYNGKTININFILSNNNDEKYRGLNDFMQNLCGWFHGVSITGGVPTKDKVDFLKYEDGEVVLQYEAKFDVELGEIPEHIYHLTTCDKLPSIQRIGLTPHNSINYFNFEGRIYFSLDKEKLKDFAKIKSTITENKCFAILDIQLNGFSDRLRFFMDPNFVDGVYTLENIPHQTIKVIETFELGDNQ
jgi:hypothetical protein